MLPNKVAYFDPENPKLLASRERRGLRKYFVNVRNLTKVLRRSKQTNFFPT